MKKVVCCPCCKENRWVVRTGTNSEMNYLQELFAVNGQ